MFIDTSDGYGPDGHNERLIDRAIRGRRDEVVVATKFGFRVPAGAERHHFPVGYAFQLAVNCHPSLVRGYAEQSLRELGTDRIDLYYPHFPDPQVPLADTVGAVCELIGTGLVRHLGLSNVTAAQLQQAYAAHPWRRCRRSGRGGVPSTRTRWRQDATSVSGSSPGHRLAVGS